MNLTPTEVRTISAPVAARNIALAQALARLLASGAVGWHDKPVQERKDAK